MSLRALLDAGAAYDAEYGRSLSNHRPMALAALKRLGADDARLAAFDAAYSRRLHAMPPPEPWPAGEPWPDHLGHTRWWPRYRALFTEWLREEGHDLLRPVLPRLLQGVGAAAFHGLIRTAYGLQSGHMGEIADGLAYWACRWLPLEGAPADPDRSRVGLIFEGMQDAAAAPGFEAALRRVPLDDGTLPRLAKDSADLYAASGDFVVLHLVTSAHAMRSVLPFVDEPLAGVDGYRRAWVAARRACGATAGRPAALLPWDEIVAFALGSDDDHLVKLVDSCREETAQHGGDAWQRAASRAVSAARSAAR